MAKTSDDAFRGFTREGVAFLRALKRNNRKEWFEAHRAEYEEEVVAPSMAFLRALQEPLHALNRHLEVTPRSMYRIHRDTRFSKDKSPYKTWVGYHIVDGRFPKNEAPGLALSWDPTGVAYGGGVWQLGTAQREAFRRAVTTGASARRFSAIVARLRAGKRIEVRGKELKRMPAGYDAEHPNAEFLLYSGCFAFGDEDFPAAFFTPKFVGHALGWLRECAPLVEWLAELQRAGA